MSSIKIDGIDKGYLKTMRLMGVSLHEENFFVHLLF
jgi:hypothetical protein